MFGSSSSLKLAALRIRQGISIFLHFFYQKAETKLLDGCNKSYPIHIPIDLLLNGATKPPRFRVRHSPPFSVTMGKNFVIKELHRHEE